METREIRRGELYWLVADDEGGSIPPIAHPHLVLQEDVFNRSRLPTVIVCALTTNLRRASEPGNVLLGEGEGDLPRRSVVVVSQLSAAPRARFDRRIGALTQARVDQVLAGLRLQQASFFGGR
ncbi:MAG: type II toxin-antitoxin system PemK/MazF family toxin [Myxococcales bacterium]|nr:type II toxin-antitoxin system PemK/MazF family toxin [Myxococcales bacterium]